MDWGVLNQVLVLFLIILTGYYSRHRGFIKKEMIRGLTELLLNITLPAMVIVSFNQKYSIEMLIKAGNLLLISVIAYFILILVSFCFIKGIDENIKKVFQYAVIFSNCGFMGFPVIESIFGKEGIFYASIFNIPFNILLWTVGIIIYNGKGSKIDKKQLLFNPGTISVIIGLLLFIFSIKLPSPLYKTLDILGGITVPLSMMIIGSMLYDSKIKNMLNEKYLYIISAVRLIIIPIVMLIVLKTLGFNGLELGIPVVIFAMPVAANSPIFAEMYCKECSSLASESVFMSTLLSVLTIPLIILFL